MYQEAGQRVGQWQRVMILTHHRSDADALGAMAGCQQVLRRLGHEATAFVYEPVPGRYTFIDAVAKFETWPKDESVEALDRRFDGILIVDTCSWSQLEPVAAYLRATRLPKLVIDHHATRDELSSDAATSGEGSHDYYAIDPTSASACGLVFEWTQAMGWPIDRDAAEAILAGMAADTGWFRFSNTDGRTLRAAATLIEAGPVPPDILYAKLNASFAPARMRLMAQMLNTLEFHANGSVAVMTLTRPMFEAAGALASDAEELVNVPMDVHSVVMTLLMTDMNEGAVRLNFRSKSPELIGREIDVSAIARQFGGGGHHRAAGARVPGQLADVRDQVISAVLAAV